MILFLKMLSYRKKMGGNATIDTDKREGMNFEGKIKT